jgi:glycosyltransferase involved in cell wall biosynthesis
MKLVYLSHARIPSRTANSVQIMKMCEAFAHAGHEVCLVAPEQSSAEAIGDPFDFYGVDRCFRVARAPWPRARGRTVFYAFSAAWRARAFRPDVVYGRFLPGLAICALLGLPVVFEAHKPVEQDGRLNRWSFRALAGSRLLRRLVVISEALADHFRSLDQVAGAKILTARDAADEPPPGAVRNLPGHGELRVGYIGHLYAGKGMELVEPLARLCPWADFHVVGGTPEDIACWRGRLTHADNVYFHGFVPPRDTAAYRGACDVLLAPYQARVSAFGGGDISQWMSPLKIFEYMASGKPIVCSDLPVLREVLRDGDNALLRPAADPAAWAEALGRLRAEPAEAGRLGRAARGDYLRHHTWRARAEAVLAGL